jgi:hypothetical protein
MVRALLGPLFRPSEFASACKANGRVCRCLAALRATPSFGQFENRLDRFPRLPRSADFTHPLDMHGQPQQAVGTADDAGLTYRAAASMVEREQAFRLVYDAYLESGLVVANRPQMRILPHHLLSTTEMFVALDYEQVVSTVTLVRDGELGLPMEEIYPEQIAAQRLLGKHLGEVSCLASIANLNLRVCLELFRVMVQAARQRGIDALLVAIHPKHERFYRRYLAFEALGGRTGYPSVCNNPAVALLLDFQRIDIERPANWQRFFGEPLPPQTLRALPMSVADKRHVGRLLVQTGAVVDSLKPLAPSSAGRKATHSADPELPTPPLLNFEPITIG